MLSMLSPIKRHRHSKSIGSVPGTNRTAVSSSSCVFFAFSLTIMLTRERKTPRKTRFSTRTSAQKMAFFPFRSSPLWCFNGERRSEKSALMNARSGWNIFLSGLMLLFVVFFPIYAFSTTTLCCHSPYLCGVQNTTASRIRGFPSFCASILGFPFSKPKKKRKTKTSPLVVERACW